MLNKVEDFDNHGDRANEAYEDRLQDIEYATLIDHEVNVYN